MKRTHGMSQAKSGLYRVWGNIVQRCTNPNNPAYHNYGGRGITLCARWREFENFLADLVEQPEGMTLDRIDNDRGYEPNNVRWATRVEQANNRVTNVFITHEGLTMTLADWARHKGWKYGLLGSRWKKGIRGDELFAPPKYVRTYCELE